MNRVFRNAVGLGLALALFARAAAAGTESQVWSGYLDYAYVYSSADARSLNERLKGYGNEAGISLERYTNDYFGALAPREAEGADAENQTRRKAIAYLLLYLENGSADSLETSAKTIRELQHRLDRHENSYWYHYIMAHRALERGNAGEFVTEVFDLWLTVVVPIEATYATLDTLSLSDSPNSGFVAALPYVYENIARLVVLRSQEKGIDHELDPLGAIVRMLYDNRVGAYPDVIPAAASSRAYLERIVDRLNGPESDEGSLTFTLALLEAGKRHEEARGMLAKSGLSADTLRAMRTATGAYEVAFKRAGTVEGQCAVYTRVLRVIGELYAARQRLGVDAELDMPFSIEGAIGVYATLRGSMSADWKKLGYQNVTREQYLDAMQRLWEEIQETSLNVGDYYLSRSVKEPGRADEMARNGARVYGRYLTFFHQYATEEGKESLPDSAYFAAFEAAKGVGGALLSYAQQPTPGEVRIGTERYRAALMLFPFDRELWPAITGALGRHGRQSEYAALVRPIAEHVVRSRAIQTWIEQKEPDADRIARVRRALSDSEVVLYMGFAESTKIGDLEHELSTLSSKRSEAAREIERLTRKRDEIRKRAKSDAPAAADASGGDLDGAALPSNDLADVAQALSDAQAQLVRIDQQISARTRALPLYKETLATDGLAEELRLRRDHPVHTLLRRMYHELRSAAEAKEKS
ncbi:MAG TPA: hypothetical protein VKF60_15365 [Myxococcota bacterium]|nr:hypothetical protein [Myxococcota bacterium]